jgi:hypothetical protein
MSEAAQQLGDALGRLTAKEALALARAVETARVRGKEVLPTDLVLAALRPQLRAAQATRVPNLRRLVCGVLADFVTDDEDDPRLSGRIARAAITPWWRALTRLAGPEIRALEQRLAELHGESERPALDDFAREAQEAAAGWTAALLAELEKPRGDAGLRQLFPRPALVRDVKEIAALLALAAPLNAAFAAIDHILHGAGLLSGRGIVELAPEAVTAASQHYRAISDAHGMDSRYLALALLNRLDRPWHILRLGRALSWKQNDSLVRDTEFGAVGERLIIDLQRATRDIIAQADQRAGLPDLARLAAGISGYMDDAEGLLGEFGFRRDSAWGEAILQTRVALANAVGRDLLGRITEHAILARLLPVERRAGPSRGLSPEPDLSAAPSDEAQAEAAQAARFLLVLVQRGSRHGLGQSVRETLDTLGAEIESRAAMLLDARRQAPDDPIIAAQLGAAIPVLDMLFDDGRGSLLARRMRIAGQVTA